MHTKLKWHTFYSFKLFYVCFIRLSRRAGSDIATSKYDNGHFGKSPLFRRFKTYDTCPINGSDYYQDNSAKVQFWVSIL